MNKFATISAFVAVMVAFCLPAAGKGSESPAAALGKKIFFDPSLSGSGRMSCATCHSPAHAYGPPNGLAVQLGGPALDRQGARAVPSLRYVLNRTPLWNQTYIENVAERLREGQEPPVGGFAGMAASEPCASRVPSPFWRQTKWQTPALKM